MTTRRKTLLSAGAAVALAGCTGVLFGEDRMDARGDITVVIDGEAVDLTADRFQSEHASNDSAAFHLHAGEEEWFMEGADPVTAGEAIDLLPHFAFELDDGDPVVTVDGTTYDGTTAETSVAVLVDGESVDPMSYTLRDGDSVRLEIETAAGDGST
ncbi:hypothetical protein [Halovivax limisalsi]|uniref:hypothetical protein n=1 Tax=Halovivax limisalsi TaxID=1453760 RepID=UPI001FFC75C5|nr:hypothetical protein [Halovivax limisalsi]